ncbi:MAG: Uma2 family endonuclease [Thermotogae bacterium]|nr:Uma2 family endonuclease [Thermotogota bacterium]
MKEAVLERPKEKVWTYEDYLHSTDEGRYELINGRLEKMPAPSPYHQAILRELGFILFKFVKESGLGEIFYAPVDVVLDSHTVVQPDVVFIAKERMNMINYDRGIFGVPDLIVEIVSRGSFVRDKIEKFKMYERFGVKEYWIVYPGERAVEVWVLKDGKYELHSVAEGEGKVRSEVLKGLKVEVGEVFKDLAE